MSDPVTSSAAELYNAMLRARGEAGDTALREALDMLAVKLGENRFRHAGAIIGGKRSGRAPIDDKAALRRIAVYPPDRRREAVGIVAGQMAKASGKKVESIERRLHRKLEKNETDKMVLSASSVS